MSNFEFDHILYKDCHNENLTLQGSICETRKAPTAPRFQWVFTISYMPMFRKPLFLDILTHRQAKTFHISLFPGHFDHPVQRYSLEKNRWQMGLGPNKANKTTSPYPDFVLWSSSYRDYLLMLASNSGSESSAPAFPTFSSILNRQTSWASLAIPIMPPPKTRCETAVHMYPIR